MRFKRLDFFFDETGKPLGKIESKSRPPTRTPRIVTASGTRSAYFYLSTSKGERYGDAIQIHRSAKNVATDPYNCDGRPPTLWTTLFQYTLDIVDDYWIEISGIERPNLCWAGKYMRGYDSAAGPMLNPPEGQVLGDDERYAIAFKRMHRALMNRQRIILYPNEKPPT